MLLWLVGLAALSILIRAFLATKAVHAPIVFNDELGYTKLAQSIGLEGRMALLDEEGFSYSPLYPTLLAPIYALGASGPTAYFLIKIVNAVLISLAIFPLYKIARFVLPRHLSVPVAAASVFAPVMSYPAFTMSENLAYPLCLTAVWSMLAALRRPGPKQDAVLLASILLATAARIQLIVLLPVALTAALLVAAGEEGPRLDRRLARALREHWLLFGVTAAGLVAAGIRALTGGEVYSAFGRYASVGRAGFPRPWRVLELALHHVAELDLAVGVVPFAGALVAGFVFVRAGRPRRQLPFVAVAVSLTAWLILQIAFSAALFDGGRDVPRIHERFMIYVIPLFFVALFAVIRLPEARASARVYLVAGACAAALPAVIPFGRYINSTIVVDTFGLLPLARSADDELVPVRFAPLVAVWLAATPAVVYVRLLRHKVWGVIVLLSAIFTFGSALVWTQANKASVFARSFLPAHTDWVDRANPVGGVVLVADEENIPALETVFHNLTITRVYTFCSITFGPDFGERQLAIDETGRLRAAEEVVAASYAVVPTSLGVRGRVVARNPDGSQVLVAPADGHLRVSPGKHVACT